MEKVKEMLTEIVQSCFERVKELKKAEGHVTLERGFATIPLPGIDVPFHSRYLWAGVMPFRACRSMFHFSHFPILIVLCSPLEEDPCKTSQPRYAYWQIHPECHSAVS